MRDWLFENFSYKVVALFVAGVLWATMLGKKESVLTREFQVQPLLSPQQSIAVPPRQKVRVEVSGPRLSLKRFAESTDVYTLDLTNLPSGRQVVRLSGEGLNPPVGVKVLSVFPEEIVVQIRENGAQNEGARGGKN